MKKITKIFLFFFVLGVLTHVSVKKQKLPYQKDSYNKQAENCIIAELKKEERELRDEIRAHLGVDIYTFKNSSFKRTNPPQKNMDSENPVIKMVYDVAKEYNICPDNLEIVLQKGNDCSPAYSNELNQIIIEMNLFPEFSESIQKFLIAHELYHIKNNDFQESRFLKKSVQNRTLTHYEKELLARYGRFQEKRADVCAAVKGISWAEGYLAFAQEGLRRMPHDPGTTHPTYKQRAQIAQNILNGMQTA